MKATDTVVIANTSVFAALAIILTFANLEVPFPLLPYLKFDMSEIPIMVLVFLMGPVPGLVAEVVAWVALSVARGWVLGPAMKFLAVVPMIIGYWIGVTVWRKIFHRGGIGSAFACGSIIGAVARIAAAAILNIVVLLFIAPDFLKFAGTMLRVIGLVSTSTYDILLWTLILTSVFNAFHVMISAIPAVTVVRGAAFKIPWVNQNAWMLNPANGSKN